jgi:hypothetical protein
MQHGDARAGTHGFGLSGSAGYLELGRPVAQDLAGELQRGREDQIFDIADQPVLP